MRAFLSSEPILKEHSDAQNGVSRLLRIFPHNEDKAVMREITKKDSEWEGEFPVSHISPRECLQEKYKKRKLICGGVVNDTYIVNILIKNNCIIQIDIN
jgi:hypothetical protein